jgi:phospholipid/cholesterol/gamma-HCH transport system substrate-binding protein
VITRVVRFQLIAFLVLAVVGVGYAGFRYAGFGNILGATTYPVRLQLTESGGIFSGADVTYRGVSVGRVGPLTLTDQGVQVQLDIERDAPPIPADVDAEVHNLSAIGEQFVDLLPASDGAPFLEAGSVIPASRASTPVAVQELIVSLDDFVRSVPQDSLRTVVDELGTAFADTAQPLQQILDTTDAFTADAVEALPQTLTLIRDGRTVLTTQNDVAGSFRSFSRDLALLADRLAESDPDLRLLLETGPAVSAELVALLDESGEGLGQLVANLLTVSRIAEPRQDGLRQLLVTYPGVSANAYTPLPGDGTAHLGLVINAFDPPPCAQGYQDTPHREGDDLAGTPVHEDAFCAEPPGSPVTVRGAQNVPEADTPMPPPDARVGAARNLPAGSAPVPESQGLPLDSAPPMSSPAQILLG